MFQGEVVACASPYTNRTSGRNNRKMDLPAPPLPVSNSSRPRQMVLAEAATTSRGWDNGVGGYQTNSMLETRIGNNQEGKIFAIFDSAQCGKYTTHSMYYV